MLRVKKPSEISTGGKTSSRGSITIPFDPHYGEGSSSGSSTSASNPKISASFEKKKTAIPEKPEPLNKKVSAGKKSASSSKEESSSKKKKEKKKVTDKKIIDELTKDCSLIDKKDYIKLQVGDRIKYVKNGEYKDGGFIWYSKIGDKNRQFWMVSPQKEVNMSSGAMKFPVFWDKIEKLYLQNLDDFETKLQKIEANASIDTLKLAIARQQIIINELLKFMEKQHGKEFVEFKKQLSVKLNHLPKECSAT